MPSRQLLLHMTAIGVSTWLAYKWIGYATFSLPDGTPASDLVSFWEYFKVSTESAQLSIGTRYGRSIATTGSLGVLGYLRELLQIIGFMAGGFVTYAILSEVEACKPCRRYAKTQILLEGVSPEQFDTCLTEADLTLPHLAEDAKIAIGNKPLKGLSLILATCPRCQRQWARPAVVVQSRSDLETKKLGRYAVTAEQATAMIAASGKAP
jgi:hypothetical protein